MNARPTKIDWHDGLSVFASESFLNSVGDKYGWLGGFDTAGGLRCILPFTVIRKAVLRLVRFRVETIALVPDFSLAEEKAFLNSAMDYFRSVGMDVVIPASNNCIFRTFPSGAYAAPYGSYIVDLLQEQNTLWHRIHRKVRQNINSARQNNVHIQEGMGREKIVYNLIRETFKRSGLPFMNYTSFMQFVGGLGHHCKIMIAEYQNQPQSCVVFAYSHYSAYAIYGGNLADQQQGSIKLLCWEAMLFFKQNGVRQFDFFGTRIWPQENSKQADLACFKSRFGAWLKSGYMWKFPLNPRKFILYSLLSRILRGGDIVDAEAHKLEAFMREKDMARLAIATDPRGSG